MVKIEKKEIITINGLDLDDASIEKLKVIMDIGKKYTLNSIVNILTAMAQTGIAKFEDGNERIDSDDIHLLKIFYDFVDALPDKNTQS